MNDRFRLFSQNTVGYWLWGMVIFIFFLDITIQALNPEYEVALMTILTINYLFSIFVAYFLSAFGEVRKPFIEAGYYSLQLPFLTIWIFSNWFVGKSELVLLLYGLVFFMPSVISGSLVTINQNLKKKMDE